MLEMQLPALSGAARWRRRGCSAAVARRRGPAEPARGAAGQAASVLRAGAGAGLARAAWIAPAPVGCRDEEAFWRWEAGMWRCFRAGRRHGEAGGAGGQPLRAVPALARRRRAHVQPHAARGGGFRPGAGGVHRRLAPPPPELLRYLRGGGAGAAAGTHSPRPTERARNGGRVRLAAFRAALQQTVRKWRPEVAQLEFTQMAQYAGDCAPARTMLVEHDITFDLYEQLARETGDWETRAAARSLAAIRDGGVARAWTAWSRCPEKDRRQVEGATAVALAERGRSRPIPALRPRARAAAPAVYRLLRAPAERWPWSFS